jgi:hypothetical protein
MLLRKVGLLALTLGLSLATRGPLAAQTPPTVRDGVSSRPLTPGATATPQNGGPLFESLGADHTGVDFQMQLPDPLEHIREFTLLSVYGGMCAGDYDADGLVDFYVTSPVGGNRLYKNLGDFRFRDVTAEAGVHDPEMQGSGATFADVDNDGDLDIYACSYAGPNRLFINQGPGPDGVKFVESAARFRLAFVGASMTMAFADMDGDGDLDGYLATTSIDPPPGVQFSVHHENGKPVVDFAGREYWELLYLPNNQTQRIVAGQYDHLFRNDGGTFADVAEESGVEGPYFTLAATWWDYDADGRPDLYAANDFLGPDRLYRNAGGGKFANVAAAALPHIPFSSMGLDLGDVNNDGRVDFFATEMLARRRARRAIMSGAQETDPAIVNYSTPRQELRNALYLNVGGPRLIEAARQFGVERSNWTWTPRLADLDNDGFLDLYVTTGSLRDMMNGDLVNYVDRNYASGSEAWCRYWSRQSMLLEPNVAFRNESGRRFADVGSAWGLDRVGVSYGAVTADFDNDGDLDLVVNNADAPLSIYRNHAGGQSVRIELRGTVSNKFGVGATVTCEAGGRKQAAYLTLARGWLSALEPAVHFGLGNAESVDALTVKWPSGKVQRLEQLAANHVYTITEPADAPVAPAEPAPRRLFQLARPNPPIVHQEQPFDDFAVQPLLPYRLSQPGPALAWADVDADGDLDGFLGGSRGRSGRLLINDQGNLAHAPEKFVETVVASEAAAAAFLDVEGDGDQDLFVVTGSVESPAGDAAYRDLLYLNDGSGTFSRAATEALPDLRDSGSVAAPCDFDQDGDVDLFVGSRSVPGAYPTAPENRLLVNDGQGRFTEATPEAVKQAGMVTDACWVDADGDGWLELVLTTDWGPVRLYSNQQGQLVERTAEAGLAERLGWWLALAPGDLDGDGDLDFAVTNFGRNTPYVASAQEPLELLYGDVEGLGQPRIIEVEREDGVRYPRRYLHNLLPVLATLGTKYKTYAEFSTASLEDVFGAEQVAGLARYAATELDSGILWNDGGLKFRFAPLPDLAQVAPASDAAVADVDGDARPDVVLAQNLLSFNAEVGRLDGGMGLVLKNQGREMFEPLEPTKSGVLIPTQMRFVAAVHIDADKQIDLAIGLQPGPLLIYRGVPAER